MTLRRLIESSYDRTPSRTSSQEKQDEKKEPKQEEKKVQAKKPGTKPVIITAFGNRIIITSEDAEAVATVRSLIRLLVNTEAGPGDFEVIRLQYANAVEVARILDEAYNGPKKQGQGGGGRPGGGGIMGAMMGGVVDNLIGGGGRGGDSNRSEIIRVVADPASNSLLLRARPIDLLTIRRLVYQNIDIIPDSETTTIKTFVIGPLKNANAGTVAEIIEKVYRESMSNRSISTQATTTPGLSVFTQQRTSDPVGDRHALLSFGVDGATNSLVVACPTSLKKDIEDLVLKLDDASGKIDRVATIKDVDTVVVSQVMDAFLHGVNQPATTAASKWGRRRPGRLRPRRRVRATRRLRPRRRLRATRRLPHGRRRLRRRRRLPGGGGFGIRRRRLRRRRLPRRRRWHARRRQARRRRWLPAAEVAEADPAAAADPAACRAEGRIFSNSGSWMTLSSPPFFTILLKNKKTNLAAASSAITCRPTTPSIRFASTASPTKCHRYLRLRGIVNGVKQDKEKDAAKQPELKGKELVPEGKMLHPELAQAEELLKQIAEQLKGAEIQIELVPLRFADPTQVTSTLNQLYTRLTTPLPIVGLIAGPRGGVTQIALPNYIASGPGQGGGQGAGPQPANVIMIPQPRLGGILVAAAKLRLIAIKKEIQRLDEMPSDTIRPVAFQMHFVPAARVAAAINTFIQARFTGARQATQNQIRITFDDHNNSLIFVQAPPADLEHIRGMIEQIDTPENNNSEVELRVVPLRSAVSDDLAKLLIASIADGVLTAVPSRPRSAPAGAEPRSGRRRASWRRHWRHRRRYCASGAAGAGTIHRRHECQPSDRDRHQDQQGQVHQQRQGRQSSRIGRAGRHSHQLRAAHQQSGDHRARESDGARLGPHSRVGRAPQSVFGDSHLHAEKDRRHADGLDAPAALFGRHQGAGLAAERAAVAAPMRLLGTTNPNAKPLQLTLSGGVTPEGAPIIDLRLTVDERSNSLLIAGSRNDLNVAEAIIDNLDNAPVSERRNIAIRLRNQQAADVANAITPFYTALMTVFKNDNQATAYLDLQRQVIVQAEPISNSLLISATPQYFDEVLRMIANLDTVTPQVVVQVLVAEVTLNGSEEFGIELGLQSPVLFNRGIFPTTGVTYTSTTPTTSGLVAQGATATVPAFATPGFPFNNPNLPFGNNVLVAPGQVGMQGITNLGTVGRTSASNNVGGFVFQAQSNMVNVLLRALKTQERIDVLSRPQLMAMDNQTALINVGQQIPINAGSTSTATGTIAATISRADRRAVAGDAAHHPGWPRADARHPRSVVGRHDGVPAGQRHLQHVA